MATKVNKILPTMYKSSNLPGNVVDQIWHLAIEHSNIWNLVQPSGLPEYDTQQLAAQALEHPRFGYDKCIEAIKGHYFLVTKEAHVFPEKIKYRAFRYVFPWLRENGKIVRPIQLDTERFAEFISFCPHKKKQAPKPEYIETEAEKRQNIEYIRKLRLMYPEAAHLAPKEFFFYVVKKKLGIKDLK